ncbi:MAG: hypothetical protein H0T73_17895, partial [Ardenticatenales bacterium]|nr:hypothetical protein [Ardenticatenales bacterium]
PGPNANADAPAATETIELASLSSSATPTATESATPSPDPSPETSPSPTALPSATRPAPTRTVTVARVPTQTRAPTSTVAPALTATPSATPTLAPPTETATVEPPTRTPTPEVVACVVSPSPRFAALWESNEDFLGCPMAPVATIPTLAEETFEGGYLFWRSDTDQVFAIFDRSKSRGTALTEGRWQTSSAWRWDGSNPEGIGLIPPDGRVEPIRGFGFVWRTFLDAQDGLLGWALEPEHSSTNVGQMQQFENGFIFLGSGSAIYILANNGTFIRR